MWRREVMRLHSYVTHGKSEAICGEQEMVLIPDDGTENQVINLYRQMRYQTMEGFGGALTDASGYIFSRMP